MGAIVQLGGASAYVMYGTHVTLVIKRSAGDYVLFDHLWGEGGRVLTYEEGGVCAAA